MSRLARNSRFAGLILVGVGLLLFVRAATLFSAPATTAETPGANAPAELSCEGMFEPLGISQTSPRLSWQLTDRRRGALQTAYQVRVAPLIEKLGQAGTDSWDTGKIESNESLNVPYAGPALLSRHRYYWQVRVWDVEGKSSAWSKPGWWEMGLLAPGDWKAQWITRDLPVQRGDYESKPKWIWSANENALATAKTGKRDFRLDFTLSQKPKTAILFITGKDNLAVWINGRPSLAVSPMSKFGRPRDPWGTFHEISVDELQSGRNSIAAETTVDKPEWPKAPLVGGFIAMLRVEMPDGTTRRVISSPDWKTIEGQRDAKWTAANFDDSSWPNATIAAEIGQTALGTPWPAEPISWLGRDFKVTRAIKSARIYSTALGTYQLYLNGTRVGDDVLAPGWTDYKKRVVYQVYDVTHQIRNGANSLVALLAGGWYGDGLGWLQNRYNFGPPPVRLMGQLEIEYDDGTRDTLATDESWRATSSALLKSDIYNGETYDARLEDTKLGAPSSTSAGWTKVTIVPPPDGAIVAQDFQPIRKQETLIPKAISNPSPGVYVFDLGQNMVGWARLHVSGNKGSKVQLRFAEVLKPNGDVYTDNLRTAEATDTYILRGGGPETFEPHFTFHGFRYIQLTGYPGTPTKNAVEGIAFYTSAPFTMKFHSANETLNQLASNILWGQRGNFLSVPTDCPQRDERLGWMGDAEVFWRTASYNADLDAFSHKFTQDIRDAQSPAGAYADVSPRVGPTGESAAGWGDAGIIIPWTAYMQFGDTVVVKENWPAMEKWMGHLADANPNYLWLKERGNDYGDWVAIGSQTSKDMIATAYWAYDATLMKQMAAAVGRIEDAEKYGRLFDQIRAAFQLAYVKEDGTVGTGSQTSYALALHMNMLDEKQRSIAAQKLVDDIASHGYHLTTGFLGTPYLLLELSKSGHSDVAYKLLLQRSYPSWFYMIDHGATTMWERWNGDQKMDDPSMNSFNHYAYGAVAEWLYRYAAGIDEAPDGPGFHNVVLHPQFNADLKEIDATFDSRRGQIASHWKVEGGSITWSIVIPANAAADLHFPASLDKAKLLEGGNSADQSESLKFIHAEPEGTVYHAGAGSYTFQFAQP
jgi:alpha-L-rhamnosidase